MNQDIKHFKEILGRFTCDRGVDITKIEYPQNSNLYTIHSHSYRCSIQYKSSKANHFIIECYGSSHGYRIGIRFWNKNKFDFIEIDESDLNDVDFKIVKELSDEIESNFPPLEPEEKSSRKVKITPEKLGQILYEEFEKELWGDVDPNAFKNLPKVDEDDDMAGLYDVVERTCKRINENK
jgi:hypothetical protein